VSLDARERLIVALDAPSVKAAGAMAARLGDSVWFYKIGYQLAFAGGLSLAAELIAAGKQVFLDLKLHDIGNTVTKGVESIARLGELVIDADVVNQERQVVVMARNLRLQGYDAVVEGHAAHSAGIG